MIPASWSPECLKGLHPEFQAALEPLLDAALQAGLTLACVSSYRSNAKQKALREVYEKKLAEWEAGGKKGPPPLSAAKPGGSAHNFALCATDKSHAVGGAETCPVCGGVVTGAGLAVDVSISVKGLRVATPGAIKLALRPKAWQQLAGLIKQFPALRDGGTFSRPDPVHIEFARWDVTTRSLRPAV
jgi:hypothetical protein